MRVMKFGGTSVGSAVQIRKVAGLIGNKSPKIVVLSAMSGTTNTLVVIAGTLKDGDRFRFGELVGQLEFKYVETVNDLFGTESCRRLAVDGMTDCFRTLWKMPQAGYTPENEKVILAQGELLSTLLMHLCLKEMNIESVVLPALEFMRLGGNGEPDGRFIRRNLCKYLRQHRKCSLFITQGYICRNAAGEIDNLQRGGSDYTASLIGAAVRAEEIQIWTDIDGLHNNDPRIVPNTVPVRLLSFDEASRLAYFGAKILHPLCIQPAEKHRIPVRLLNTMQPEAPGTLITECAEKGKIKAVAAKDNITYIKIRASRSLPAYKFISKVFGVFARCKTPVDLVTTSEVNISVSIDDPQRLQEIVAELGKYAEVTVEKDMVIVCVVGDLEWHNVGFEARIIGALRDIPVRMISYGESSSNVALVMRSSDKSRALQALNEYVFV